MSQTGNNWSLYPLSSFPDKSHTCFPTSIFGIYCSMNCSKYWNEQDILYHESFPVIGDFCPEPFGQFRSNTPIRYVNVKRTSTFYVENTALVPTYASNTNKYMYHTIAFATYHVSNKNKQDILVGEVIGYMHSKEGVSNSEIGFRQEIKNLIIFESPPRTYIFSYFLIY